MSSLPPPAGRIRRGRGEGSISERPDGRFLVTVDLGLDGRGKRQRRSKVVQTRSQARAALKELHRLKDAGVDLVGAYTTLEAFLDRWYATLRPRPQGRYSQSTLKGYRDIIRLHLKPVLGQLTLLQLAQRGGAQHIQRLQDTLLDRGLAAPTVRNVRNCLSGALSYAVQLELIDANPVKRIGAPPASTFEGQTLEDDEDAQQLARVIRGDRLEAAIYLELACGLRRSEVLGLEWTAVKDLDTPNPRRRPRIEVLQTRQHVKDIGIVLQEPKTRKSRRTLFLPPFLVRLLRERREQQAATWHGFIFTNEDGSPIAPSTFTRYVKALLIQAGLPADMRGHDLRHSFASIAQAEGLPAAGAMAALGHSNMSTTSGIYTHASDPMRQMAADIFDAYHARITQNSA